MNDGTPLGGYSKEAFMAAVLIGTTTKTTTTTTTGQVPGKEFLDSA
jgi:hypothetical protein